ncbi:MAG: hypothetical protein ACJ751_04970 [Niastella sp.]|uniref:hypothetical protein n=1 Tax=Niastella sp. TaxID=1869183 RepID=UPI00389ACDA0
MRKGSTHSVRLSEFCDYMHIDDILVQVFLASLKRENPPPPIQVIEADYTDKPLRDKYEVKKEPRQGIIIHMPLSLYDELNPLGEAMYKRKGLYRCIVRPYEVAQIYDIHINTARAMLRKVRKEKELPARAHVSIEKYCQIHHVEEDVFRHSLVSIHEDDKNIDDDDD